MTKCPHCGALAEVEPSTALRWRCAVCGGPLVPTPDVQRPQGELASLVRAQRARAMALGWTAAVVVLTFMGLMGGGLGLLLWSASHLAAGVLGGIGAASFLFALISKTRSSARNGEARAALDQAWQQAANEVLQARGGELTAPELARVMRTDQEHAEALLSGLSAGGRARVEVRDDAELAYRVATDDVATDEPPAQQQKSR